MIGIAVLLFALGGAGLFLLQSQVRAVEKQEADTRAEVGSSQQIADRYDSTMAQYQATQKQLQYLEAPEPANMYVPTMLQQLEALAKSYNCQIKTITPSAMVASSSSPSGNGSPASSGATTNSKSTTGPQLVYSIMPVSLALSGSYAEVMHFIYNLTRFKKVVTVKSVALRPEANPATTPGKTATAPQVDATLELQVYVFATAPTAPTTASSGAAATGQPQTTPTPAQPGPAAAITRPVTAALAIQGATQQRLAGAGLAPQPMTQTLPINSKVGK
jgi:Tfp pilus assembly protein PilO